MQACSSTVNMLAMGGHAGGKYTLLSSGPDAWSDEIEPVRVPLKKFQTTRPQNR